MHPGNNFLFPCKPLWVWVGPIPHPPRLAAQDGLRNFKGRDKFLRQLWYSQRVEKPTVVSSALHPRGWEMCRAGRALQAPPACGSANEARFPYVVRLSHSAAVAATAAAAAALSSGGLCCSCCKGAQAGRWRDTHKEVRSGRCGCRH